jgi:hypothetical protein
MLSLWDVLYNAYAIGSHGTVSENTEVHVEAIGTAAGRSKAAEKRALYLADLEKCIAEAEKTCRLPGRGLATFIGNEAIELMRKKFGRNVSTKTVSRHRNKMRTL